MNKKEFIIDFDLSIESFLGDIIDILEKKIESFYVEIVNIEYEDSFELSRDSWEIKTIQFRINKLQSLINQIENINEL